MAANSTVQATIVRNQNHIFHFAIVASVASAIALVVVLVATRSS